MACCCRGRSHTLIVPHYDYPPFLCTSHSVSPPGWNLIFRAKMNAGSSIHYRRGSIRINQQLLPEPKHSVPTLQCLSELLVTPLTEIQGVSKKALQWHSKCCCVASVTQTFKLKDTQTTHRCKALFETLHYQWKSQWTATIPDKTRCVLLHYDNSKHWTCPLNKFIQAFEIVKLFLKHTVLLHSVLVSLQKLWFALQSYNLNSWALRRVNPFLLVTILQSSQCCRLFYRSVQWVFSETPQNS
jgi:hypothetical protein